MTWCDSSSLSSGRLSLHAVAQAKKVKQTVMVPAGQGYGVSKLKESARHQEVATVCS